MFCIRVRVADPYRWLEDANSPETAAWVKAQNAVTKPYLDSLPERGPFRSKLARLLQAIEATTGAVNKAGDHYLLDPPRRKAGQRRSVRIQNTHRQWRSAH